MRAHNKNFLALILCGLASDSFAGTSCPTVSTLTSSSWAGMFETENFTTGTPGHYSAGGGGAIVLMPTTSGSRSITQTINATTHKFTLLRASITNVQGNNDTSGNLYSTAMTSTVYAVYGQAFQAPTYLGNLNTANNNPNNLSAPVVYPGPCYLYFWFTDPTSASNSISSALPPPDAYLVSTNYGNDFRGQLLKAGVNASAKMWLSKQ